MEEKDLVLLKELINKYSSSIIVKQLSLLTLEKMSMFSDLQANRIVHDLAREALWLEELSRKLS